MRAGGQHGDDHLGAFHGILCADGGRSPFGHDFGNSFSGQVKGVHVVSGLGEVDGHGRTHIAQANECNRCHAVSLLKIDSCLCLYLLAFKMFYV